MELKLKRIIKCNHDADRHLCSTCSSYNANVEHIESLRKRIAELEAQLAKSCGDEIGDRFDSGTPCATAWGLIERAEQAEAEVERLTTQTGEMLKIAEEREEFVSTLKAENAKLREALEEYATCCDGCTCGDGWSHTTAEQALKGKEQPY